MNETYLFVRTDIDFASASEVLTHIGQQMLEAGVVHDSYPQALHERESHYPTGILLEQHAVAIPHCEAIHAKQPAVYVIRPNQLVHFQQADGDESVPAALVIALVVTNPADQLVMLRRLFSQLQDPVFLNALLASSESELSLLFRQRILNAQTAVSDALVHA